MLDKSRNIYMLDTEIHTHTHTHTPLTVPAVFSVQIHTYYSALFVMLCWG